MLPDYDVIGKRIKKTRIEKGLTQEQVADLMDVSTTFMSRIERGSSFVNLKRLTQISEILKVTPGYLLTGSNTNAKDYLKQDFTDILSRCTPKQQKFIYQITELVYKNGIYENEDTANFRKINNLVKKHSK